MCSSTFIHAKKLFFFFLSLVYWIVIEDLCGLYESCGRDSGAGSLWKGGFSWTPRFDSRVMWRLWVPLCGINDQGCMWLSCNGNTFLFHSPVSLNWAIASFHQDSRFCNNRLNGLSFSHISSKQHCSTIDLRLYQLFIFKVITKLDNI